MTKSKKITWAALGATLLASGMLMPMAQAQTADALLDKLVDKGVLSVTEANELRDQADNDFNKAYQTKSGMPDWVTQLKIYGDLRGRWDFIKTDNDASGASQPNKDRSRFRYRLRVGAVATMTDNFELGFRLTSAEPNALGGDPISGNTSYQDNGSKKFIYIDQAYGKWTPIRTGPWLLSGTVGKMENPFVLSDMVFDPDYTPEGFAIQSGYAVNDNHGLKLTGGLFVLDEINQGAQASDDPLMAGVQLRYDAKWSPKLSTSIGAGVFAISDEENLATAAVPNINVGNTRNAAGAPVANFHPFVVDAGITYMLDKFPLNVGPFPIRLAGEFMHNPGADDDNTGYWAGIFLGKSGKKGTWDLSYRYKRLEADAWYEEFVDSDTGAYRQVGLANAGAGAGYRAGTGLKGHVAKFAYSISDAFTIGVTYYLYELIDEPVATDTSAAHRVQLDAIWKF